MIQKSLCENDGTPKLYTHKCSPGDVGRELTFLELDEFAKEIVTEKYLPGGTDVRDGAVPGADLYIAGHGTAGHDVVVRYRDPRRTDYGIPSLAERTYEGAPVFPVAVFVDLWNAGDGTPDKRPAGGQYFVRVFFKSLLPFSKQPVREYDADKAAKAVFQAWSNLDSSYFEDALAEDFQYASDQVFAVITSKKEYLDYITGKYKTIQKSNSAPEVRLCRNRNTGQPAVYLNQRGNEAILDITMDSGYISEMVMHGNTGAYQAYEMPAKGMDLYEFEFRLLPFLFAQCNEGKLGKDLLADKAFIQNTVSQNAPACSWDWSEFDVITADMDGAESVIVFTFPLEDTPLPRCKYAAAVFGQKTGFYTLEHGADDTWFFCRQSGSTHSNFGEVERCDSIREFLSLLEGKVSLKHSIRRFLKSLFK